ncbi:MAG TPA: hypothetical protein VEQ34_00755, partial [Pyrinomonadaceae bacterium]|nr:hypothetical protein [Pyrinomonadaceae bacterium]
IQILKNLDKKFPNQAAILGVIGGIYFSLRDWENSYIYYKKTAKLAPKSETASIALFHCLFELEKYDESLDEIKRFISISQKFDLKLKEYNLLLSDWKRDLNLKTDDYFEIAEAFFRTLKLF